MRVPTRYSQNNVNIWLVFSIVVAFRDSLECTSFTIGVRVERLYVQRIAFTVDDGHVSISLR